MATRKRESARIAVPRRTTNEAFFDEAWERLRLAFGDILNKDQGSLSFEELYRNAYNLVVHKRGPLLYDGVSNVFSVHLRSLVDHVLVPSFPIATSANTSNELGQPSLSGGAAFLRTLRDVWNDYVTSTMMIRDVLRYMDKAYVTGNSKLLPIYNQSLHLFKQTIITSQPHPIQQHILSTYLDQVYKERQGDIIDKSLLKSISEMLLSLDTDSTGTTSLYHSILEPEFLTTSTTFYTQESENLLKSFDATQYLVHVETRISQEDARVSHYMYPTTLPKIHKILYDELLERHLSVIIEMENSGLVAMLDSNKVVDLARMYKLFAKTNAGHDEMLKALSAYIKSLGKTINFDFGGAARDSNATTNSTSSVSGQPPNPVKWVEAMIELKDRFDLVASSSFDNDKLFTRHINSTIEVVVNENSRSSEFVSLFIDENLRKGLKGKSENEVDELLDKTIMLFRFIGEKDVFERYYKQHLAKRLLFNRSVSDDAERGMISRLKVECGYQFTHKLEGMFNDMRLSLETMQSYKSLLSTSSTVLAPNNLPIPEISVNILTSTFWPMSSSTTPQIAFSPELTLALEKFQKFYLSRHSGRRLTFLHNMGTTDLRIQFDTCKKEINVSTYATVVLLNVFSTTTPNTEFVEYTTIREKTAIPDLELKRTLQSLSLGKYKILLKRGGGKDVADSDGFCFNGKFTASLNKIKIPTISSSASSSTSTSNTIGIETDEDRAATMDRIDEARKYQVEAAIVRIMKSRKQLEHNVLVGEVVKMLSSRFSPSFGMVKQRIEGLIEREYLDRDKKDRKLYNYVA